MSRPALLDASCIQKQVSMEPRRVVHRRRVAIGECLIEGKHGLRLSRYSSSLF